ncbi:MAG: hypothetical protein A2538_03805 [Candidatus Magasanikbacteria bacterium RIFOXYD2_FULL_41_14]|uniref:Uncharacterized protein n=1 Tax=Candidatus Magasanikbacteria bacterium RIFOXYD2_FULL_41_14 TaxID=1798709 RepID=A0A1F6PCS9_9BACT|nr:MAG: hypothetical protein A2538_03805 [Candidatus Magasanikbacteria bacterium RIFOXYD2_FULL_41_14]
MRDRIGQFCHLHGNILPCASCAESENKEDEKNTAADEYRKQFSGEDKSVHLFGDNIAFQEKKSGLSQQFLKEVMGLLSPHLAKWFKGNKKLVCHSGQSTETKGATGVHDDYGMHSVLKIELTGEQFHEIAVNSTNIRDVRLLTEVLMHEIGHSVENRLSEIADQNGFELSENKHRWPDLIAMQVLYPEKLTTINTTLNTKVRDTLMAVKILGDGIGDDKLRTEIEQAIANERKKKLMILQDIQAQHPGASWTDTPDYFLENFDNTRTFFYQNTLDSMIEEGNTAP